MSTYQSTTVDRLRQAIAETLSIDAQGLQAAIGQLVVAASADYPAAGPEERSLHSSAVRTTVLLADRIPAGQEAQALAQEIALHHGRQAAQAVIGERAAELLGGDGKVESAIDLDDVGEWVGLHYGRNFDAEPDAKRQEWIERYAEAHDLPVPQGSVCDEAQNPKSTVVEYVSVWDEGTVTTHAVLDLRTGAVTDIEASDDGQDYEHLQYEEIRDVSRGVSAFVVPNDKGQYFLEDLSMLTQFGGADIANEERILSNYIEQPQQPVSAIAMRIAEALPANSGYEKGYKDALESIVLALSPKMAASLDEAVETALDAYSNNVDDPSPIGVNQPGAIEQSVAMNQKYRVLGAHPNRNFFAIEVQASNGLSAFGAAAVSLKEADEDGEAEFFAAIPAHIAFDFPGDGVVTLGTVLDPEQADVFGLEASANVDDDHSPGM